jgi:5-oxoprolinase (ATP-hydrolysing)
MVNPSDFSVDEAATKELRQKMREERKSTEYEETLSYNRGGSMTELMGRVEEETGLKAPKPQWEKDPYGPHVGLEYVREWYRDMRAKGLSAWDF